jgi:hypothetical protein
MEDKETAYTRQQVITALRKGIDLVACAAGAGGVLNPLHDATLNRLRPSGPYTRKAFTDALNAAANALDPMEDPDIYETSDTIWAQDVLNLAVNAAGHVLDHPDADLFAVVIEAHKDTDVPPFVFEDDDDKNPAKGSAAWNSALYTMVMGWIA